MTAAKLVSLFKRVLWITLALCAIVWIVDWAIFRSRVAKENAFGEVMVHRRYAVKLKNRQTEFRQQKPKPEECVRSLFPHVDESPCWYLEKYPDQTSDLDGGPWHFWYQ